MEHFHILYCTPLQYRNLLLLLYIGVSHEIACTHVVQTDLVKYWDHFTTKYCFLNCKNRK